MGWKIFTVVFACFALSATVGVAMGKYSGFLPLLSLALHLVAVAGLASYAFRLKVLPPKFWRWFSLAYAVFSISSVGYLAFGVANKIAADEMTLLVAIGVLGIPAALQFFSWLPSRRLSTQTSWSASGRPGP